VIYLASFGIFFAFFFLVAAYPNGPRIGFWKHCRDGVAGMAGMAFCLALAGAGILAFAFVIDVLTGRPFHF
jgi:hypothetical protein